MNHFKITKFLHEFSVVVNTKNTTYSFFNVTFQLKYGSHKFDWHIARNIWGNYRNINMIKQIVFT